MRGIVLSILCAIALAQGREVLNKDGRLVCNCDPGEAPGICADWGNDGILVAHERCDKFYQCFNGVPVPYACPAGLLYNKITEQCDWPQNVDCGDRTVGDTEDCTENNNNGDNGDNGSGGEGDNAAGGEDGDNGSGGGDIDCNCNPEEAPSICAAEGSEGVLVAHENCNKFYICDHGKAVAVRCPEDLLFNPYTNKCDWPERVDCGDRVIPDSEDGGNEDGDNGVGGGDSDNGAGGGDGDNGVGGGDGDNGAGGGGDGGDGESGAGGGNCNCNPGEATEICAADGSDGVLVAHENCNQFYKCSYGKPVALKCPGNLLYNPYTEQCDWPENVECGDRIIPDDDDGNNGADGGDGDNGAGGGDGDNGVGGGGGDNGAGGGDCNCNPGEAPGICAVDGSDGILIAHENCNQFYICAHGKPVALRCPGNLLYNPYTEQCDWPENVECGDRIIPDGDDGDNGAGGGDGDNGAGGGDGDNGVGGGDGDNGAGGGGGDNGAGGGECNCNPGEAPGICAVDGSDGVLIAHENCNQFYICAHGKPVALRCPGNLLYNPYTEQCDWPENVECGDRIIPDGDDGDNGAGGGDGDNGAGGGDGDNGVGGGDGDNGVGGGDGDNGAGGGGGDNGAGGGECNCNPGEAPGICAVDGSDGVLIAHENCNQFYICAHGKPVALRCPGNLLYNPYTEQCDWPENVECGDRIIPDGDDGDNGAGGGDGDNGAGGGDGDNGVGGGDGDNGADGGGGDNGAGGGECNCNPGEAPGICAVDGSDGVLIAHENCNQFYICAHGKPVALRCPGNLLYNPYTEQCDWPENVECGDRIIPDGDDGDNGAGGGDGDNGAGGGDGDNGVGGGDGDNGVGGGDGDNGAGGGGGDNGAGGGECNCNPGEAPGICAVDGSDGVLIAHENCNQFYICAHGKPVALRCPGNLLYNPYTEQCDWPENVECGDRIIPDGDDGDNGAGGGDGDNGAGGGDGDNGVGGGDGDNGVGGGDGDNGAGGGGGDNGAGGGECNCNPGEAPGICAVDGSDGVLIAHENCNQFYICAHGKPVALRCPGNLLYNPYTEQCDWPENVECGDRIIPDGDDGDNGAGGGDGDNGAGGGDGDNGVGGGDGDNGVGGGDGDNGAGGGGGDNGAGGGECNCNPGEAPGICAVDGSDGVLIAHENCNQFYICAHGKPVALKCPGNLLYNPYTEQCDWPENVECGDRIIPDGDDGDNGVGGGDGDNGPGGGGCNCNPGEAPEICAADGSDGVLVAHENCNQFYKCAYGKPVALKCPGNLLYNPYTEQCDWPENVECGDRIIPDGDEGDNGAGGGDGDSGAGGGDGDNGAGGGDGDNGPGGGGCNCNPGEAPEICAADGADGVLVAHENCNQFYKCSYGKPVALKCPGNLLYNPYTEQCDWPENVDCGDRLIPDGDDGDSGGNDNGDSGDNDGDDSEDGGNDNNGGNDDPSQAPDICATPGSNGVLVAHEDCDKFYMCNGGIPVAVSCPPSLLFNPAISSCDWPRYVDCGNRTVPDNGNDNDGCHCDPRMAPSLCAREGSDGMLIAHENCNQYYTCVNGATVPRSCPMHLFYNPRKEVCDWPVNVDCDSRLMPTPQPSLNKHLEARRGVRV